MRIVEYTFRDQKAMDEHIAMMSVPLQGTFRPASGNMVIRSTALYPSGAHASLFTVTQEPALGPLKGSVIILAATIKGGHEAALRLLRNVKRSRREAGGYEEAPSGVDYTVSIPGEKLPDGYDVAVMSDGLDGTDDWGQMRSAAYALGLDVLTEHEFHARQSVVE